MDSLNALPVRENVCAVVVSYCPQGDLAERLRVIQTQVGGLVVVDNGSSDLYLVQLKELSNVHLILNPKNEGLPRALNQGAEWAAAQGFSWILTLDQDTVVDLNMVHSLYIVYQDVPEPSNVAVIGANYRDCVTGRPFITFKGDDDRSWLEVKTAITSGSLIPLSNYRRIGPFLEELFIDGVDFEYCLRARSLGLHVVVTREPLMRHGIGNASIHKLPWKTTTTSNHSPTRRYYMTRNYLVLARAYFWDEPTWIISILCRHFKDTILMCLFEKDVVTKLKCTAIGIWDGFSSNFGRKLL